jgi:hypothetical protein
VLLGVLDDVGELVGGDPPEEAAGEVDELLTRPERHPDLPERESRDVAVDRVVGVVGQVR